MVVHNIYQMALDEGVVRISVFDFFSSWNIFFFAAQKLQFTNLSLLEFYVLDLMSLFLIIISLYVLSCYYFILLDLGHPSSPTSTQ